MSERHPSYEAINDRMVSTTDPDAGLMRKGCGSSRPTYHHHRAVDDAQGVITAGVTTSGAVPENQKLMDEPASDGWTSCPYRFSFADQPCFIKFSRCWSASS